MIIALFIILFIIPQFAHATTYWVSTGGGATLCSQIDGDEDPGAYMTYTALDTNNCAGSGDTVMFKAGTYTGSAKKLNLLFTAQGTAATPNMVLCEGDRTCILQWNLTFGYIVYIESMSHIVFGQDGHGFKVNCTNGTNVSCGAVGLRIAENSGIYTNITTEGNWLTGCSVSCYHEQENVPLKYFTNNTVRKNQIDALVADLSTTGTPHPIYIFSEGSVIEYNNVSVTFGYGLHGYHICYNSIWRYNKVNVGGNSIGFTCRDNEQGRSTGVKVYGNIFKWTGTVGQGTCIRQGADSKDIQFYNNVCDGFNSFIDTNATAPSIFQNNVCTNGNCRFYICTNAGSCTITTPTTLTCGGTCSTTNPTVTAASHFKDATNYDYSLISGSSLIDAGLTTNGVRACNGTCDRGAHETFAPTSASINSNSIDITLGMNLHTPPQFPSSTTGWSVSCVGTGCGTPVVSSVSLLSGSSTIVRLTIGGITGGVCAVGQTWTWTFNSATGSVTDSANIGDVGLNQPMFTHSTQAITNSCSGSTPAGEPPAGYHIFYRLDDGTSGATPTSANDESANNLDGTLQGGATWTTGKYGSGVAMTEASGQYITIPYGNTVDPSSQSLSIAFGVNVTAGQESKSKSYFGASSGTNQRVQITTINGSWCLGIQGSGQSACNTALSVQAGWNRIFMTLNSATDTATLCVNGITGTGPNATKTYTSFALPSNFALGRINDAATGGGGVFDQFVLWTSVISCSDDYTAWEPSAPPSAGTLSQVAHQWQKLREAVGGTAELYLSQSATVPVAQGGAVSLVTQINCTSSNCDPIGAKLWYTRNGGSAQAVPDMMTSDQVSFYGTTSDPDVLSGAVTCCLTGALTPNNGGTRVTSDAEVFDIGVNGSYTRRVILKFGSTASGTYCFFERDQNGNALNGTYTPSGGACAALEPVSGGTGF